MKKAIALFLTLALLAGLLALPAAAADADTVDAVSMVRALGIITGDAHGNLNLSNNVTRAEFCKMLVSASSYKDTVGGSTGYSLFRDVKSTNWAVGYIKVCVDNSWFIGYANGTFRPGNPITLEEAATVALRLLGYTSSDIAGSYPTAQLSKFSALGLHDGFSTKKGQYMTRSDCAQLFYNLMAAQTKDGKVYASTLGYTVDSSGHVDYASLISAGTKGPYTLTGGTIASKLPFTGNVTVYRNGLASTLAAAADYDVYYYNANIRTVWIYTDRVTGTYKSASPSTAAPTSVTVAGTSYSIETSAAAYKLSTQGTYKTGDQVTLLLGMNGGVADVCSPDEATGSYCGMVLSSSKESVTAADGTVSVTNVASVICTDGAARSFETGSSSFSAGALVQVDYSNTANPVSSLSSVSASGKVSSDGKTFGSLTFADDAEILDTDSYGGYVKIYPSRLAGATLSSLQVRYYALDENGEISRLILRGATGDTCTYGVVLSASESTVSMNVSGSYTILNGSVQSQVNGSTVYSVSKGPAAIFYSNGAVAGMRNLTSVTLDSATSSSAVASNRTYKVSESCAVYLKKDSSYYSCSLSAVSDTSKYSLTGWYHSFGYPAGGRIRVIVAEAK